jgi:sec-independent protein translocase protein TatC
MAGHESDEEKVEPLGLGDGNSSHGTDNLIDGGKVMSLWDHLGELRNRVVKSLLGILVLFLIALTFAEHIIGFLKGPLTNALPVGKNDLHFTGPLDVFIINIKVSLLAGVVFGTPLWLYQFWKFFEPALYPKERKYILPFVFASSALFIIGVCFAYFVILPIALKFLLEIGLSVGTPIITIKDYLSLVMILVFGFGLVFETPIVLILLAMLDLVSAKMLSEYRRFVLVLILVMGAVLTPPDPISQVAMAIPVYLMYEASIILIRIIKKEKRVPKNTVAA